MSKIVIEFPKGQIVEGKNGKLKIVYNKTYVNKFNTNMNKTQVYLDNKVIINLQDYVSYKTGTQAKSIRLASEEGSGYVTIGVPYASIQAYSGRIKKRVGKRGTRPFERMVEDKKTEIFKQVEAYARRLNG